MKKWKIAFWCCLVLLISVSIYSVYVFFDQAVTLNYHKVDYKDTEDDLNDIIDIVNNTNLTKIQIENYLRSHRLREFMNFETDTVSLNKVLFIFDKDTLISIKNN